MLNQKGRLLITSGYVWGSLRIKLGKISNKTTSRLFKRFPKMPKEEKQDIDDGKSLIQPLVCEAHKDFTFQKFFKNSFFFLPLFTWRAIYIVYIYIN